MSKPIYLDNQSTTPMDPDVFKAMLPFFQEKFGNASSIHHAYGIESSEAVEKARKILAESINAKKHMIQRILTLLFVLINFLIVEKPLKKSMVSTMVIAPIKKIKISAV